MGFCFYPKANVHEYGAPGACSPETLVFLQMQLMAKKRGLVLWPGLFLLMETNMSDHLEQYNKSWAGPCLAIIKMKRHNAVAQQKAVDRVALYNERARQQAVKAVVSDATHDAVLRPALFQNLLTGIKRAGGSFKAFRFSIRCGRLVIELQAAGGSGSVEP
jgi:hypothetical protein